MASLSVKRFDIDTSLLTIENHLTIHCEHFEDTFENAQWRKVTEWHALDIDDLQICRTHLELSEQICHFTIECKK